MNRILKVVAVAAAGIAIACLTPAQTLAACAGGTPFQSCLFGLGGASADPLATGVGGTYWIVGAGLDVVGGGGAGDVGFGTDAGQLAGFPLPLDGSAWITDFGIGGGLICMNWDWASFGSDGCANGTATMAAVLRDSSGNFALMQVAGSGANYDFDAITNGSTGPFGGGVNNGVVLRRAVSVSSSSDLGTTVGVTVAPANLTIGPAGTVYDDQGGARPIPGTIRLRGRQANASVVLENDDTGGSFNVDADSDLCWELVDIGYTVTLGCTAIGGNTPSQNVINGKAGFAKGGASFTWDVTAQFDVLGFNVYQKNVSKGSERKINDGLIPVSGQNDATAESYKYVAPRSDLRAWKGGFEIELVRSNGETSRAPVTIAK